MGEAHVDAVRDQPFGHFVPGQHVAIVAALPGGGVNLVDRNRLAPRIDISPMRPVRLVLPDLFDLARGHRRVVRAQFRAAGKRIGLQGQKLAVLADDLVFVDRA